MVDPADETPPEYVGAYVMIGKASPPVTAGEPAQKLDPHAWSAAFERRASEAEESDSHSDVLVGPDIWFVEAHDWLSVAYCVTLVRDIDVDTTFSRLGVEDSPVGLVDLDGLGDEVYGDDEQLLGAAQVGRWTLVMEPNGFLTTLPERAHALSVGTTAVTFYSNVNGHNTFLVTTDGVEQLRFDRMFPAERTGAEANSFTDDMLAAGFIFDEEEAEAANEDGMRDEVAGAALVERLTGVPLTVGLLNGLTWRTALVSY